VGNFDGDAKGSDDILRYVNQSGGAEVFLSARSPDGETRFFAPAGQWTGAGVRGGEGWYVGDYNGDGKDDTLGYQNQHGGAEVFLSTGAAFSYAGTWSGFGTRGGRGWYVGDYDGDGRASILRYINASGGARVLTQVCSKRTPECPSWNNEFSDNVLDGNRECKTLKATNFFQSSTPPPGCPAPPDGGLRFSGGGNLDDGLPCSGPRNGRR
jgi:FG-GAP-like repeat